MKYRINDTSTYHKKEIDSLGWELTVCNALNPAGTVLRRIIRRDASYGDHLYDYLCNFIPVDRIVRIMEIGGGYGYLMRDFLKRNNSLQATMLDISPFLLQKQRETLAGFDVRFIQEDFLDWEMKGPVSHDLVIMNENLGDFPTVIDLEREPVFSGFSGRDPALQKVRRLFETYGLQRPEKSVFNFNLGALEAVEKICMARIPFIFIGEHSCEAPVPSAYPGLFDGKPAFDPEHISLKGHDEFTIRFSHLQDMARALGYCACRGTFADFIKFDMSDRLRVMLSSKTAGGDEGETVRHFIGDLFKYEYLILILGKAGA